MEVEVEVSDQLTAGVGVMNVTGCAAPLAQSERETR